MFYTRALKSAEKTAELVKSFQLMSVRWTTGLQTFHILLLLTYNELNVRAEPQGSTRWKHLALFLKLWNVCITTKAKARVLELQGGREWTWFSVEKHDEVLYENSNRWGVTGGKSIATQAGEVSKVTLCHFKLVFGADVNRVWVCVLSGNRLRIQV